jgi:transcriptional regulator with PAS, ATPase and Fis domain
VQQVAGTDATVLITGETGTGKELVARAVHLSSHRREGPFISINCSALPETLIENELFGHERGAYTDASTRQIGKVAQANGGTLFLDEVGDLAASAQAKVLRLIEEHEYIPLGATKTIKADVRIVAATNRDLAEMVTAELFREDLYWRLRVIPIHIPPLRKRGPTDIKDLADHFMNEFSRKYKKPKRPFKPKQLKSMTNYPWPGNVRELRSFVERYLLLGEKSLTQLLPEGYPPPPSTKQPPFSPKASDGTKHLIETAKQKVQQAERDAIIDALNRSGGNKKTAAKVLGISYRSLFYKLEKHNISTEISAR